MKILFNHLNFLENAIVFLCIEVFKTITPNTTVKVA